MIISRTLTAAVAVTLLLFAGAANAKSHHLSGVDNYYLAYAPNGNPEELVNKLGERYEIARTNIKKWTVGSPIQAPLDALEILLQRQRFSADQVKDVVVRVSEGDVVVAINQQPVRTPQEAAEKLKEAAASPKKSALLLLNRRGVTQYVGVNLSTNQG